MIEERLAGRPVGAGDESALASNGRHLHGPVTVVNTMLSVGSHEGIRVVSSRALLDLLSTA